MRQFANLNFGREVVEESGEAIAAVSATGDLLFCVSARGDCRGDRILPLVMFSAVAPAFAALSVVLAASGNPIDAFLGCVLSCGGYRVFAAGTNTSVCLLYATRLPCRKPSDPQRILSAAHNVFVQVTCSPFPSERPFESAHFLAGLAPLLADVPAY